MRKKGDLPKYDVHQVTERFVGWLGNVNPGGSSPMAGAQIKVNGSHYLQREGLQLYVRVGGIDQLMWWEQSVDISRVNAQRALGSFSFHVLTPDLNESHASRLLGEYAVLNRIFRGVNVRTHCVPFGDQVYTGLCVDAPVAAVPLGRENHLSEKLFVYAERGIARPARGLVYDLFKRTGSSI